MVGGNAGSAGSNVFNFFDTTELIPNKCTIPSLPKALGDFPSLFLTSENNILLCGGTRNEYECLEMKVNNWIHHSDLIEKRGKATSVTMAKGTFIFGGHESRNTWEWLPSGSSTWVLGGNIPDPGFFNGCGVPISANEILLVGGQGEEETMDRILKFSVETNDWTEMNETLQPGIYDHSCISFKNSIIVSGGKRPGTSPLESTQMINKDSLTVSKSSDMNQARREHRLVVAHYNNQTTVLAIGGMSNGWKETASVEKWDPESEAWSLADDLTLSEAKYGFGALSVPTRLLCP